MMAMMGGEGVDYGKGLDRRVGTGGK